MPKVTFEKLSYPALSPTTMCVQLADSTVRYPEGVVENLLVKVRNTFILADFVVLDMEGDLGIPLILGQPFLRDANARVDVGLGKSQPPHHGENYEIQVSEQEGIVSDSRR